MVFVVTVGYRRTARPGPWTVARRAKLTGVDDDVRRTRAAYDRVAEDYAARFAGELRDKPLDRGLLDAFAQQLPGPEPVADLGCGPGQVTRYLADRGVPALGVDLSPAMVALARRLVPGVEFRQGSLLELPAGDGEWAGITAFYAIIHLPPGTLPTALAEFHRALRGDGLVLLAFHVGEERITLDEWLGHQVSLDFQLLSPAAVEGALEAAGFTVAATLVRAPYPSEHPTRRAYVLARRRDG